MNNHDFNKPEDVQDNLTREKTNGGHEYSELQTQTVKLKKMFFSMIIYKQYEQMKDMLDHGLINVNVTDRDGKNVISYLVENLESKYTLDGIYTDSCCISEHDYKLHNETVSVICDFLQKGVKPDLGDLNVVARKGHANLVFEFLAHADLDVTEKINGKTVREIAFEAGYPECAQILEVKENTQSITLARQNNALLKENNALLKQILENQEKERNQRIANMEQTKNLLMCMMSYLDCLGSTKSTSSRRITIMDKFHSHLNGSHHTRD